MTSALSRCLFPPVGHVVDLAVSGGADSVAMTLLAREAGLRARVHHVDHRLRPTSSQDARLVGELAADCGFEWRLHSVEVGAGANLEARARAARRAVLPRGTLTGHSMDDVAETVLINLLRGAGTDGLSPMVGDATKPVVSLRRRELLDIVLNAGRPYVHDESNDDLSLARNRIRHEVLPSLNAFAQRDLVPILTRQAELMREERNWLDELLAPDVAREIGSIDCRELRTWPTARLRRWLRATLTTPDTGDGSHPPSAQEIERVMAVVRGEVKATQLSGARWVSRSAQHLRLDEGTHYASPGD